MPGIPSDCDSSAMIESSWESSRGNRPERSTTSAVPELTARVYNDSPRMCVKSVWLPCTRLCALAQLKFQHF